MKTKLNIDMNEVEAARQWHNQIVSDLNPEPEPEADNEQIIKDLVSVIHFMLGYHDRDEHVSSVESILMRRPAEYDESKGAVQSALRIKQLIDF